MTNYFKGWKDLRKELGFKGLMDGLFGSLVFTIILLMPILTIYFQVISMYYHRLNLLVFLLTLTIIVISVVQLSLWKKAIRLKKPDLNVNVQSLFYKQMVIHGLIILSIGLLFIFVWIPLLQV